MTDESLSLIELVETKADDDLVREMLTFAAERIMEAGVKERTGAAKDASRLLRELQRSVTANGGRMRGA